jgi:hypothetical protein
VTDRMYGREYPNNVALRWMLHDFDTGTFEKRHNLEVSQRYKGKVSVSITINGTYFGIDLSPEEADDLAAGVAEMAYVVRERDGALSASTPPEGADHG